MVTKSLPVESISYEVNYWNKFYITDYVSGGELFTHLNQNEQFEERDVRIYIGEITLALETLHQVKW